jgi:hypothetical protein
MDTSVNSFVIINLDSIDNRINGSSFGIDSSFYRYHVFLIETIIMLSYRKKQISFGFLKIFRHFICETIINSFGHLLGCNFDHN